MIAEEKVASHRVLEGIGIYTDGAKPCADVVTGLCGLEPSEGQSKAES
jgi:hypothetical protein